MYREASIRSSHGVGREYMKRLAPSTQVTTSLEQEYLRLLARQSQRVPIPVFLVAAMIAGLAYGRIPTPLLAAWLALVVTLLVVRRAVLGRLPTLLHIAERRRLRFAVALSGINGVVHALSLGFFAFLPEFERALQSMLFVALCAGSVATTAGYRPVFLAYVLPMLVPLMLLWGISPGVAEVGWIQLSTAALIGLFIALVIALANDAFRLFRESFAIRLQQIELNDQLQKALEQAEAASNAKTRFLASASHDLRQPIHTLSLFGAALTLRPLDKQSREIAQHMNTALQVLASQLDALLDISKLDAGVVRVNATRFNLHDVLERVYNECLPGAREKRLHVTFVCPPAACIDTDQPLFERIVRNLLDNAIKYTDTGCIRLHVTHEGDDYVLAIADPGRGIPEAEQGRIFEEFYQLENPERDRTRGLGLGLAIVRRLTGLLQIEMDMESAPGHGTTFTLRLPVAQAAPAVAASAGKDETGPRALHVLVVDDEAGIRLGMKTLLEAMGCRATLVDGTQQAMAAVRAETPDLVLSDLRLRGDDSGIDTVRSIRELHPRMPAILISGDIAPDRLRQAEEAGIPLLHKPVPVEILKQAIAKTCQR
jgi:signal transduction histidine kinase